MSDDTPSQTPDQRAAHDFLTELRTRIATQTLPFQQGVESSALTSLYQLFGLARAAIKAHPGCDQFAAVTIGMLNHDVRPVTAYWHRQSEDGLLATRDGAIAFRQDLADVQVVLRDFAGVLHKMAYGTEIPDIWDAPQPHVMGFAADPQPMPFGIPADRLIDADVAAQINAAEAAEIRAIRTTHGRDGVDPDIGIHDATGLAFSGGGIRSASFGLGVAQALADRGLLKGFDVMSTVSGGGFVGGFITRRMGQGGEQALAQPDGPDTPAIAHLRHRASYMDQGGRGSALGLASRIVAGMLWNWTAPGFLIAALALCLVVLNPILQPLYPFFGAIGLTCAALGFLYYGVQLRYNVASAERVLSTALGLAGLFVIGYGIQILYVHVPTWVNSRPGWTSIGAIGAVLPAFSIGLRTLRQPIMRKGLSIVALVIASIIVPLICLMFGMLLFYLGDQSMDAAAPTYAPLRYLDGAILLAVIVAVLGAMAWLVDINLSGPHRQYRDGLARTFVQTDDSDTAPVPLTSLNPGHIAPHHLINAVVNLPSSSTAKLHERKGDFFVFSKHFCGAPTTGYHPTEGLKSGGGPLDLATAIATSGAAVAPHMALLSFAPARMLLAFLNLRLGFWLGRPQGGTAPSKPGFRCLMREMLGTGMTEDADWLFLTDGGHLENSAVYELLRRRCRFIVAVDSGSDKANSFGTLATLNRHARIDFGIEIDMALDELRVDLETGLSPAHAVLTQIKYPAIGDIPAQTGLLLVIKLSLTGDEGEMIKAYRNANPDFPIQSTADQSFDEAQFENYRRLGVHATQGLFKPTLIGTQPVTADVADLLTRLSQTILR